MILLPQTDGTQWVYGVGGAREIGEGQICVPSSGWYFTLDYHFDKQNRARVTEHIRAVVVSSTTVLATD